MRAIEFYSGIGGLHWALVDAVPHAQVVAAFDINEVANDVYQHNFGMRPNQGNIQRYPFDKIDSLEANMWLLSPPCQPYTRQGLRMDANDARAFSFLDLLEKFATMHHPPDYVVLENVVGFESSVTRKRMVDALEGAGFVVQECILSPHQLGIPYSRPRYFCMAKKRSSPEIVPHLELNGYLQMVSPTGGSPDRPKEKGLLKAYLDDDTALDCCEEGGSSDGASEVINSMFMVPDKVLEQCCDVINVVTSSSTLSNCFTKSYAKYVKGTGAVLATRNTHLLMAVQQLQDSCCNYTGSEEPEGQYQQSRSQMKRELLAMLRSMQLRYLTPREISRLHSFPEKFTFPPSVSLRQKYALLGNSLNIKGSESKRRGMKPIHKRVKLIASDVDGTLLNSKQQLTPGVISALEKAADAGIPTLLATGKAPGPWLKDVVPKLPQQMPMVLLQGLLVWDSDGKVVYERGLETEIIEACITLAEKDGTTLVMYCGDRILCEATDKHTDRLIFYKEPTPEAVGKLREWVGKITIHKVIFMMEDDHVPAIRSTLQEQFGSQVSLTTALPGMVEVLPYGECKGASVNRLLKMLEVEPGNLMALGDGENDLEMLELAGVAIAMGNAGARVKEIADYVVSTNNEDGVAEAIEKYVLSSEDAS